MIKVKAQQWENANQELDATQKLGDAKNHVVTKRSSILKQEDV